MKSLRAAVLLLLVVAASAARADVTVVEYYNATLNHYFITPVAAEIALLDARAAPFPGLVANRRRVQRL